MPEHVHDGCIELCFCSRGSLVFACEGQEYTLTPDNVFLTQPGDRHHLTTNHKGMRMYWLFFRYPRKGRTVLGLSASETTALVKRLKEIKAHDFAVDHAMRQHFRDIFKAYDDLPRGAYRTLVLRTLILQILLMTINSANNRPSVKVLAKISDIAKLIASRPSHMFVVAEMAEHAKMSESHFTALFRQVIGLPPYAYLSKCRLEAARTRLSATNDSIREISKSLGFSSPQHLAGQFRKTYGVTASEWRASQRT
jgi:AraC-like DNA-binding protein